jgi:hypothetical protein
MMKSVSQTENGRTPFVLLPFCAISASKMSSSMRERIELIHVEAVKRRELALGGWQHVGEREEDHRGERLHACLVHLGMLALVLRGQRRHELIGQRAGEPVVPEVRAIDLAIDAIEVRARRLQQLLRDAELAECRELSAERRRGVVLDADLELLHGAGRRDRYARLHAAVALELRAGIEIRDGDLRLVRRVVRERDLEVDRRADAEVANARLVARRQLGDRHRHVADLGCIGLAIGDRAEIDRVVLGDTRGQRHRCQQHEGEHSHVGDLRQQCPGQATPPANS